MTEIRGTEGLKSKLDTLSKDLQELKELLEKKESTIGTRQDGADPSFEEESLYVIIKHILFLCCWKKGRSE